jgi:hypothetical protein
MHHPGVTPVQSMMHYRQAAGAHGESTSEAVPAPPVTRGRSAALIDASWLRIQRAQTRLVAVQAIVDGSDRHLRSSWELLKTHRRNHFSTSDTLDTRNATEER